MSADPDKPISECSLWDVIDWDTVVELSLRAPSSKSDLTQELILPWHAKRLVDAGSRSDHEAEMELKSFISRAIGTGEDAVRRQKATYLAGRFGADGARFIEYLGYKFALFKNSPLRRPKER